jgi:hypothetical protein
LKICQGLVGLRACSVTSGKEAGLVREMGPGVDFMNQFRHQFMDKTF